MPASACFMCLAKELRALVFVYAKNDWNTKRCVCLLKMSSVTFSHRKPDNYLSWRDVVHRFCVHGPGVSRYDMKMNEKICHSINSITLIGNLKLFKQTYVLLRYPLCPCINSHSTPSALVYVHIIYLLSLLPRAAFAKGGRTGFRWLGRSPVNP